MYQISMVFLWKCRNLFLGKEDLYTAICIVLMIINYRKDTLLLKYVCPLSQTLKKIDLVSIGGKIRIHQFQHLNGSCAQKNRKKTISAPWEKQFICEHFQKKPGTERGKYCKKRSKADLTLRHLQN